MLKHVSNHLIIAYVSKCIDFLFSFVIIIISLVCIINFLGIECFLFLFKTMTIERSDSGVLIDKRVIFFCSLKNSRVENQENDKNAPTRYEVKRRVKRKRGCRKKRKRKSENSISVFCSEAPHAKASRMASRSATNLHCIIYVNYTPHFKKKTWIFNSILCLYCADFFSTYCSPKFD